MKRAIHVAREEAGIATDVELARRASISYDTLMNWFGNRTTPRPSEVGRVADVLGLRLVELMDAWEGRDPRPPALEEQIAQLVAELRISIYEARLSRVALEEATAAILRALGASARPGLDPPGTPQRTGAGSGAGNDRV